MDQFQDSSASTLGDKSSCIPKDAGAKKYMRQKVLIKVSLKEYEKKKAMKVVSAVKGVSSVSWDSNHETLTVVGEGIDAVLMVKRLRKIAFATIISIDSVEPAKENIEKDRKQTIKPPLYAFPR